MKTSKALSFTIKVSIIIIIVMFVVKIHHKFDLLFSDWR